MPSESYSLAIALGYNLGVVRAVLWLFALDMLLLFDRMIPLEPLMPVNEGWRFALRGCEQNSSLVGIDIVLA